MNNIVELDNRRKINEMVDVVKKRLGAKTLIIGAVMDNDDYLSFVESEMLDSDLVYLIQCLKDRRQARVNEINT